MQKTISNSINCIEKLLYEYEINKATIYLEQVLCELKLIRIHSIEKDMYDLSKCVEFCFDKVKAWPPDSSKWGAIQIQFLYMTVNMCRCLVNSKSGDCESEKLSISSSLAVTNSGTSDFLANEGLDLLEKSLKMIYMCLSLKDSSMGKEKSQQMESYLKTELLDILKRKNKLKQNLHPNISRSKMKSLA